MTRIKDTLRSISSNSSNTELQTLIDLIEKFTTARDGPGDPEKIDEVSTKKELSDTSRWMKLEPADFIVESIGFDIDNSSKKYADQIENITKKILQESNNSMTGKPDEMRRRPSHTISVKEIMEVHEALKSGVDIVLNFELYLKQQHLQHIGRLHRDHILDNMAEAERQNLYNTCRTLKSQLKRVQAAFDRQRTETANLKKTKVQWENELNTKLKNYREQEKELKLQMDKILQELNEAKLTISKQSRRIEEIEAKNFLVESKLKLIEPELVKLTEYQEIIDQLKKQLVLWELDTKKFERQKKDLEILVMEWHKMEMILESKDQEIEQLKNLVSDQSEMINELRIKCKKNVKDSQNNQKTAFEKQFEEYKKLETNYDQLKKSNEELKSEVLELLAKIESLTPREPISISLL
ncbi:4778_t:CDS:2 [Entrophospora sp. SA101]|nr:3428_t:CDS:2 [Entrophospora sp. SA101]CAJ0896587.1 4778_t:CDS:2 [Entrophospora sp. SA101]